MTGDVPDREVRRTVAERGYAFVLIRLADGTETSVGCFSSYGDAARFIEREQERQRKTLGYHHDMRIA